MWAVVVVEADDGVVSAGLVLVERVLDAVRILVRHGHIEDAYLDDSPVVARLNLIFQRLDVVTQR